MKRVFALPLICLCMAFVAARPAGKPAISQPETVAERQVANKSNRVAPESKDQWRIASKWDVGQRCFESLRRVFVAVRGV